MYIIDPKMRVPLHIQLYNELKKDITDNLQVGDKLPSIRRLATTYNLSKTTVESAYSQLYAEGYIESRAKSGYYVCQTLYEDFTPQSTNLNLHENKPKQYRYDFFPARLHKDDFPLKLWKRLYNKAIDESIDMGGYSDGQGELELREEIAKYLSTSRGVKCSPSQVIISNGFSESMGLLAKMVQRDYDTFAIENPGYHIARRVYEEYGYKIEKIGIDENGIKLHELQNSKAKLLYITPSHQYPTGVAIPISNRLKLLEWAKEREGLIIEDDYDSELSYTNRPIPALQGLDNSDRVVYLGTFSKSLSPAIRVGYMVLPYHLLERFREQYDSHFPKVSLMTQMTLELFMKEGHWKRHLRRIRTLNHKKHDIMKNALLKHLGDKIEILTQGGGLAIHIRPTIPIDLHELEQRAEKAGIKLYLSSRTNGGDWEAVRMGFGGFREDEIEEAINIFNSLF